MRKLVILCIFAVFGWGCKKDGGAKPPSNDHVTVTVDTAGMNGYATINPTTYSVPKGESLEINVNVKEGNRINKVPPGATLIGNVVKLPVVSSNLSISIGATDSLTVPVLNAHKALLVSGEKPWFDNAYRDRIIGPNHLNDWTNYDGTTTEKTYYDIYYANGTFKEYAGGPFVYGTWNMSGNGKSITLVDNATKDVSVIAIDQLTIDLFNYLHLNFKNQGKDWEVFAIHH